MLGEPCNLKERFLIDALRRRRVFFDDGVVEGEGIESADKRDDIIFPDVTATCGCILSSFSFVNLDDEEEEEEEEEEELLKAVFLDALTFSTRIDPAEKFDASK